MSFRLGVDVGGTFTDLLIINDEDGMTHRAKVPSTPKDPSIGVLNGIAKICERTGIPPSEITHLMHGTTVATNAVLEGKGAKVGLVVTKGYKQVLQVARSFVPGGLAGWIVWPKPEPLAKLENTIEAEERMSFSGEIVTPLNEDSLRESLRKLGEQGIEALTISLINSFTNDLHERQIGGIAREILGDIPISLSSRILPEIREYERTLTTVANSYVRPVASKYLRNLESEIRSTNSDVKLHVLRSDGGLMGIETASLAPVNMLMSGPAGGVSGASWIASQAGFQNLLTLDMGGTSTDVALVQNGKPNIGRETVVGDLTIRASSVDVRTVGAGGGSIAHVPQLTKALRVGPQSAGADPGPAAYGKGGEEPTVTDANVVLGYFPAGLLDGEMALDHQAARTAVKKVADDLGISVERAAAGIIDIVNENMFGALRLVSVQKGYDPRDYALVGFGGAGPLHANALGVLMGSWPVIVPPSPGVLCAYGDATTRLRAEAAKTFIRRFSETSTDELKSVLSELAQEASVELEAEGVTKSEQSVSFQIDVRYHGQGFEVTVDIELDVLESSGLDGIAARFDEEHTRLFTFALEHEHELVNVRAIVQGASANVAAEEVPLGDADPSEAFVSETQIWVKDGEVTANVYARSKLKANNRIVGPAILTEMDSTTLILPDHYADVDRFGNILIRPLS